MKKSLCLIICFVIIYIIGTYLLPEELNTLFTLCWQLSIVLYLLLVVKIKLVFTVSQFVATTVCLVVFSLMQWFLFKNHDWLGILRAVVLAPIMEELLFREYLMNSITGAAKRKIIISSIIFGLYHFKNFFLYTLLGLIQQILYAGVVIGFLNGFLKVKTKSLQWPLIIHGFNNGVYVSLAELVAIRL